MTVSERRFDKYEPRKYLSRRYEDDAEINVGACHDMTVRRSEHDITSALDWMAFHDFHPRAGYRAASISVSQSGESGGQFHHLKIP